MQLQMNQQKSRFIRKYFQRKSNVVVFSKAQDYYIKDLCLNTRRFDSWAGLTVIEFYKIEELITADDFDPKIFNIHMSASCFFRQAVSVDTNNLTLWMEYAEITYILQAYCSKYVRKWEFSLAKNKMKTIFRKKNRQNSYLIDRFY